MTIVIIEQEIFRVESGSIRGTHQQVIVHGFETLQLFILNVSFEQHAKPLG